MGVTCAVPSIFREDTGCWLWLYMLPTSAADGGTLPEAWLLSGSHVAGIVFFWRYRVYGDKMSPENFSRHRGFRQKTLRLDACRCYNIGGFRETMVEICWSMCAILSIHPLFAWKASNSLALALCIQRIPLCYPKLCLGNVHFSVAFGCVWLLD